MKLIMLGPPGSGKGTVAEKLVKDFKLRSFSAGALLREEVEKNTSTGRKIKKIMEKGELVSNKLIVDIMRLQISGLKNFILDGFPRAIEQAKLIDDIKIDAVIFLDVPEKVVVERLSLRRVCSKCKQGYHEKYLPSKKKNICDKCQGKLIRRKDDNPKVIKERFKVYHKETQPLIKYYQKKKILHTIDGVPLPKTVYSNVKKIVKKWPN